ncbi:MAG: hypothetical protein HQM07_08380 [Zetaproteobacteria bacterium]|nr:hypothetical protein [Zetaproteobacteria bacterium]
MAKKRAKSVTKKSPLRSAQVATPGRDPRVQKILNCLDQNNWAAAKPLVLTLADQAQGKIEVLYQCGAWCCDYESFVEGVALMEQVYAVNPDYMLTREYLLNSYRMGGFDEHAIRTAKEAVQRTDINNDEFMLACLTLSTYCEWDLLYAQQEKMIEIAVAGAYNTRYYNALLLHFLEQPDIDQATLFKIHQAAADQWSTVMPLITPYAQRHKKMRIGYISGDFYQHAVGLFMLDIIAHHRREFVEVYCFANNKLNDSTTEYFQKYADHYIDIKHDSDLVAANKIQKAEIDLLVDLGGFTDFSRLSVLRYKPAPVQVSYLGYPSTTGMEVVDYRITDDIADPEGADQFYTEKLLRLPDGFLCRTRMSAPYRLDEPATVKNGFITFGSLNHLRKINPPLIKLWAEILSKVEGSRFIIKARGLDAIQQQVVRDLFASHGIDGDRIEMYAFMEDPKQHIDMVNRIDIALDSFPYHGTTTTCETLDMGIPIVTLAGKSHVQRVSYSILKHIGFEPCIAFTEEEYIEKAVNLALNPQGLTLLRKVLPMLLMNTSMGQPEPFVANLEQAYLLAWQDKMGSAWDFSKF